MMWLVQVALRRPLSVAVLALLILVIHSLRLSVRVSPREYAVWTERELLERRPWVHEQILKPTAS